MTFTDNQGIYLGISEKSDGPMKNSSTNRLLFFKNIGLGNKILISAGLTQGNKLAIADGDQSGIMADCDALITDQSKYLLTVTVADCLPIYFYDHNKKIVAIAHAGWRGVVARIVDGVIASFINNYHSALSDIKIYVGPHIQDCHFEVKAEVASQFKSSEAIIRDKKTYINLAGVIKDQLKELGIPTGNIEISPECTYCLNDKYFSFRRDAPKELEAMIAYIGLK